MDIDVPVVLQELTFQDIPLLRLDLKGQLVRLIPGLPATEISRRKLPLRYLANLKAALYWLQDYKPKITAPHIEQVRGYLEAFHHLGEVSAWRIAYELILTPIQIEQPSAKATSQLTSQSLPLHQQLEIWGYLQELSDLYRTLLGKLDPTIEGFCCNRLGHVYGLQGLFGESIAYHQRALVIAEEISAQTIKAEAHLGLAAINQYLEQFAAGIAHAETSLEIARQLDSLFLQTQSLQRLADIHSLSYFKDHRPQVALDYAQDGLRLARILNDSALECSLLGTIAKSYERLGKTQEALKYFQQSLALAQAAKNPSKQWAALVNLSGIYCLQLKDLAQSKALMAEAMLVAREIQSLSCEPFIIRNQVALISIQNDASTTQSLLLQALEPVKRSGDSFQEWIILRNLAILALRAKDFARAKLYLEQEQEVLRSLPPNSLSLSVADWVNSSYLLSSVGEWQRGLRHAKKALAVVRHDKPGTDQILAFLVLAYAYWQGGQRSRGIRILLGQLPQILASVYQQQDDSLRYALKITVEVVSQPLLKTLQKLRCLIRSGG